MKSLALILFSLILLGCTDGGKIEKTEKLTVNNLIAQGKLIFNRKHLGKNKVVGCVLCHSTKKGVVIIGPSLAGLSIRAPHIVPNEDARQYISKAILNPDAYIVEGFLPGTMLATFEDALTKEEMNALVEYLLQLD